MPINSFKIKSKLSDYTVEYIDIKTILNKLDATKDIYIVDSNIYLMYMDSLFKYFNQDRIIVIEAIEENKTIFYAIRQIEIIMKYGISKNTRIVSFGGGIVQDLSGFIASILYRGLTWIYFPTTLLAQTDSCIGAKTSINHIQYKNLLGTFYNPSEVYIIPYFLNTLEINDYLSGIGELVKLQLIGGKDSFNHVLTKKDDLLERNIDSINDLISEALQIKKKFIEIDEFDKGIRNILNYGHCIGHAIESTTDYSIPHGQAVSLGMILANRLAVNIQDLDIHLAKKIEHEILIPIVSENFRKTHISKNGLIEAMKRDKKRVNSNLVVVYLKSDWTMFKNINVLIDDVEEIVDAWNLEQKY